MHHIKEELLQLRFSTKQSSEPFLRVVSLVLDQVGDGDHHLVIPPPLHVGLDRLHGELGLQEQVQRLVGHVST